MICLNESGTKCKVSRVQLPTEMSGLQLAIAFLFLVSFLKGEGMLLHMGRGKKAPFRDQASVHATLCATIHNEYNSIILIVFFILCYAAVDAEEAGLVGNLALKGTVKCE